MTLLKESGTSSVSSTEHTHTETEQTNYEGNVLAKIKQGKRMKTGHLLGWFIR